MYNIRKSLSKLFKKNPFMTRLPSHQCELHYGICMHACMSSKFENGAIVGTAHRLLNFYHHYSTIYLQLHLMTAFWWKKCREGVRGLRVNRKHSLNICIRSLKCIIRNKGIVLKNKRDELINFSTTAWEEEIFTSRKTK